MSHPIPLYRVNAFGVDAFSGNPATVCLLPAFPDDALLLRIAQENRTAETAFLVRRGEAHQIRWFSSVQEVDLCGHGTLAAAHVLNTRRSDPATTASFTFTTKAQEPLTVLYQNDLYTLDFPVRAHHEHPCDDSLVAGLGLHPDCALKSTSVVAVFKTQAEVEALRPDPQSLRRVGTRSIIATAPGQAHDYVLRYFTPFEAIQEDFVTGVAQCTLAPYWAARLGKADLTVQQLSERPSTLRCAVTGERVLISGTAYTYFEGTMHL